MLSYSLKILSCSLKKKNISSMSPLGFRTREIKLNIEPRLFCVKFRFAPVKSQTIITFLLGTTRGQTSDQRPSQHVDGDTGD